MQDWNKVLIPCCQRRHMELPAQAQPRTVALRLGVDLAENTRCVSGSIRACWELHLYPVATQGPILPPKRGTRFRRCADERQKKNRSYLHLPTCKRFTPCREKLYFSNKRRWLNLRAFFTILLFWEKPVKAKRQLSATKRNPRPNGDFARPGFQRRLKSAFSTKGLKIGFVWQTAGNMHTWIFCMKHVHLARSHRAAYLSKHLWLITIYQETNVAPVGRWIASGFPIAMKLPARQVHI